MRVSPIRFAQIKVELPKYGAIKRDAEISMPMLVSPPTKTSGRINTGARINRLECVPELDDFICGVAGANDCRWDRIVHWHLRYAASAILTKSSGSISTAFEIARAPVRVACRYVDMAQSSS